MSNCCNNVFNMWRTFKVIPTVYNDALSYEEQILYLCQSLENILQQIDTDNQELYDYINSQIEMVLEQMAIYDTNQRAYIDSQISSIIVNFTQLIQSTDGQNRAWTIGQIEELRKLILSNQPTMWVTNPFTGGVDSVQNVLNDIVYHFGKGITAFEYDSQKLTAQQFADYGLTAYEYDFYAKEHLYPDYKHTMFNPWTGIRVPIVEVINHLVQLHKPDGMTTQLYTETDITAQEYDSMTLDGYEYDFNGKTILAHN